MIPLSPRRIKIILQNLPNVLKGYNLYTNPEKMRLIDEAFRIMNFTPSSFADLGGVWKVDAAYTIYTAKTYDIKGTLVDTNFNEIVEQKLSTIKNVNTITGNFGDDEVIAKLGNPDMVFFFDVLLHQVNPDWDTILEKYAAITKCFVIYNQQITRPGEVIRLTDLPLDEYKSLVPKRTDDVYDYIFSHKSEINKEYNKPWKDVHNIWQWGINDHNLRTKLKKLGFSEVFYRNYGNFTKLKSFEDHGFIFIKQ